VQRCVAGKHTPTSLFSDNAAIRLTKASESDYLRIPHTRAVLGAWRLCSEDHNVGSRHTAEGGAVQHLQAGLKHVLRRLGGTSIDELQLVPELAVGALGRVAE